MQFRPNPLLYGANEDFHSAFCLALTLREPVDAALLSRCVRQALRRYPYFCVRPRWQGEELWLESNPLPVPVFPDGRTVTLGTRESNGHLLAFGCSGRRILLHASHYLADGMGILPLLKSVVYAYACAFWGEEGLESEGIRLPQQPVDPREYAYPFPEAPGRQRQVFLPRKAPEQAYELEAAAFDDGGLYAYHLRIPQRELMAGANTSDGSPVSFVSVLLYRALCRLDPQLAQPVVAHVQHQYRAALETPLSHHSLVSYIPAVLPPRCADWPLERQNTALRGQILLGSQREADLAAVDRLLQAFGGRESSRRQRQQAMERYARHSIRGKSFGISYMGRLDWGGLDRYVEDLQAYIGEKHSRNMLLVEIMTVGGDFSLTFMQSGRGRRYLQAFLQQLEEQGIPARLTGEERYALCRTRLPESETDRY